VKINEDMGWKVEEEERSEEQKNEGGGAIYT